MKRILYFIVAVLLVFCLAGCNETEEAPVKENVGEIQNDDAVEIIPEEEEEIKPEIFYTGVVCQLPSSGSYPFTALKTNGSYDKLGEKGVYGYPEVTDDGRYVFFRQSVDRIERLYVMTPGSKPLELAQNASSFVLDDAGKWVAVKCDDGFYFGTDFSKPCERIVEMDSISSYIVSEDGSKAAIVDDETNLYFVDILSKTCVMVDTGVTKVIKKICDNLVYYAKDNGFYEYRDGTSAFVSEWWAATDFPEIFAIGTERERTYRYINSDGTTFDIPEEAKISSYTVMSANNKYLVSGSGATLYRYEVTPNGLINRTEFHGKNITIYAVNNDGVIIACSAKDQSFGIFEGSEYKKLSDGMLLINRTGYNYCAQFGNEAVYFVYDNVLYKYTFGAEVEAVKEDVYSISVSGDYCYYTTNYDKGAQKGDVYLLGQEEMIDSRIMYTFPR